MLAKIFVFAFYFVCLLMTVDAVGVERRQDAGSIVNSLTSVAGSAVSQATSIAASAGGGVFETVTSIGGSLATIITSEGGQAVTLAGSGVGKVTSFAGSEYTIATSAYASATSNAAAHSFGFTKSVLTGLASMVGGIFFGAWLAL